MQSIRNAWTKQSFYWIPYSLIVLRILIACFLVYDASKGSTNPLFLPLFLLAVFSDIFDGMIARWLDTVTAKLRMLDGLADVFLYVCVLFCVKLSHPITASACIIPLIIYVIMQSIDWGLSLVKFRRLTSYHSVVAKLVGLSLMAAVVAVFGFNIEGWPAVLALYLAALSCLEGIIMTIILPEWKYDIKGIPMAITIRKLSTFAHERAQ